jgi:hypothetical protein
MNSLCQGFLEGSLIQCLIEGKEQDVPIEHLRKGTLVKTERNGYLPVDMIGQSSFRHVACSERIENQLYVCSPDLFCDLTTDLVMAGAQCLLVLNLTDQQRHDTEMITGSIFMTGKKYRLMSYLHHRTIPYSIAGNYTIWHFALESSDRYLTYGVYANGGLLVETASIRFLHDISLMNL